MSAVYARYEMGEGLPSPLFQAGPLTTDDATVGTVPGMVAVGDVLRLLEAVGRGALDPDAVAGALLGGLEFANLMEGRHG